VLASVVEMGQAASACPIHRVTTSPRVSSRSHWVIKVYIAQKTGGRIMVHESTSICDVDEGFVTRDRSGMVVIGLSTGMMRTFLKMSRTRFERLYQDLTEFRNMESKGGPIVEKPGT
jgi:hypothetical protein